MVRIELYMIKDKSQDYDFSQGKGQDFGTGSSSKIASNMSTNISIKIFCILKRGF